MSTGKKPTQMEMEEFFSEIDPRGMKVYLTDGSVYGPIKDNISPSHYKLPSGLEVKDIMKDVMGVENVKQFYKGNIIKYILRADKKNGLEDYKKAKRYIEMLEEIEEE